MDNHIYMTPQELARRLRISTGTLANWRLRGEGPKFMKIGKKVLYPMDEVAAYEQQALRQNTAAP